MKKQLLTLIGVAALSASAQAQVIFNDTFDSGIGSWVGFGSGNSVTAPSGQLVLPSGAANRFAARTFSTQTLANGSSITLTGLYTSTAASGAGLSVGLLDISGTMVTNGATSDNSLVSYSGYYSSITDNSNGGVVNYYDNLDVTTTANVPLTGGLTVTPTRTANFDFLTNTTYSFNYTLTKSTDGTSVASDFRIFDATGATQHYKITGTYNSVYSSFDSVYLRAGSPTSFDNLQLTVAVPEPSTWALLAIGLTAVVIFRRRRQQA